MIRPDDPAPRCNHPRQGKPCRNPAGYRTDHPGFGHCWNHSGNTPSGKKYAARLKVEAELAERKKAMMFYQLPVPDITPEQFLLDEVRRSAGIVSWIQTMVESWRIAPETPEEELARIATEDDPDKAPLPTTGSELLQQMHTSKSTGLPALGVVVTWEKGGTIAPTEVSAWLRVYLDERKHALAAAKTAVDAGVAQALVRLAQQEAEMVVEVFKASFRDMGLEFTPDRAAVVSRHLRAIGGAS